MPKDDFDYPEYRRTRIIKPPQILHKYTTTEVARYILSTGKLRFQSPLRFNDPFDSQWDPTWNLLTPEAELFCIKLLTIAFEDPESLPEKVDPDFMNALLEDRKRIYALPANEQASAIKQLVKDASDVSELQDKMNSDMLDFRRRLRVLCLSANPMSVTMWSHYADQHRGVLLTLDTAKLEDGLKRPVEKVSYVDSPPEVMNMEKWYSNIILGTSELVLPADSNIWTRTKSPEWEQEREWRLTTLAHKSTLGDYEDFVIPRDSIVEITMGCRTDQEVFKDLIALAQPFGDHVKFSKLYMPLGSFRLAKKEFLLSEI